MTASGARRSVLVLNTGSSSIKVARFRAGSREPEAAERGELESRDGRPHLTLRDAGSGAVSERHLPDAAGARDAIDALAGAWLREALADDDVVAVAHRVVHGGAAFTEPTIVDDRVYAELERLVPLAPLHQPASLAAIRAARACRPDVPQVACFDTAFHRGHPLLADVYALPWRWHEAGIRRYGFHGLSYEYVASALPPEIAGGRVVVAHLGSGASLCALRAGRSVDCSMGFSALDGIPMGTRPGALDPGVLLYLAGEGGMSAEDLERMLYHESGLLGLSGVSSDMRRLLESAAPRARLAVDYFVRYVAREIGAMAASLGGVDGIVFTAGIGEHAAPVRARLVESCAWLGVRLDAGANERGDARISPEGSTVSAWVIPTDEELMIARHAVRLIASR